MDNRRRRGRADRIRVAGGERYEAQLVARKFRVGLAVVLSVIKRVGNLRSRVLRRTEATDVQASSRGEEEVRRVSDGAATGRLNGQKACRCAANFVRFRATIDKSGFWPAMVCPLLTQSGHRPAAQ